MKFFLISKFFVCLLAVSFLLGGCGRKEALQLTSVDTAMGTVIQQNIYAVREGEYTGEIQEMILELEEENLSWRLTSSELYKVNLAAGSGESVELTSELSQILEQCLVLSQDTEGAFDVTIGAVARIWDIDGWASGTRTGEFQTPDSSELKAVLDHCGFQRVKLQCPEGGKLAVISLEEGVSIDLGAIGKGLSLDRIREYLETEASVTGAVVSVGGSILTYGEKPDGMPWRVGILDPFDTSRNLGVLTLTGSWCVSTSGDYERYVESGGVRYHHILDPFTGYPVDNELTSVTVVTDQGMLSDALSTACFVLGRERGLILAQQYGVEALFVEKDGSIAMTRGMERLFQKTP